jgi:3-methyladenine DNA glycosylase/8-oxoguanine DNA glycosylase
MAEGVVDVLEAVEIDEQDRQSGLVAVGTLQRLVQAVAEQQAVGQAGQRIVVRLVIELIVRVRSSVMSEKTPT